MENSQPFEDVSGKNLNRWEIADNANCECGEKQTLSYVFECTLISSRCEM